MHTIIYDVRYFFSYNKLNMWYLSEISSCKIIIMTCTCRRCSIQGHHEK